MLELSDALSDELFKAPVPTDGGELPDEPESEYPARLLRLKNRSVRAYRLFSKRPVERHRQKLSK